VVGATDQVAGQIAIDPGAAAASQVGIIQINARTLTTDSDMRNRAIHNRILFTDEFEYITFAPTAITGLPENISVGAPFNFQVTGDLTVRDTTLPVTFEAQVTPVSETRLEGRANTTIRYADFGISIPNVPSVTDVSDDVVLEIDFAAEPL
jgi:polyisoprenoid-binding protein YceI